MIAMLLEMIEDGVHIIDKNSNTFIYNQSMAKLENMKISDVIGKPFDQVFGTLNKNNSTLLKALNKGERTLNEKQYYQNKNGKDIVTINSTVPFVVDGEIVAAMEVAKNITKIQAMSDTILELQKGIKQPKKIIESKIKKYQFYNIVGENYKFKKVIEVAKKAAKSSASVFIYGATGTGKELIAQSIHFDGERKEHTFLAQNCAALPEALLEGILFGTSRGGFTGAIDREGLFEQANGGTLLLDEINSMPYELQAKLLRVLQEGYVRRVGGKKDIPVDVRIIATTNEEPKKLVEEGNLRRDLFYRLNIIPITVPPLRERKDDILLLAEKFVEKYNRKYKREVWMISEEAKEKLLNYSYPGNVRELENIIMAALAMIENEHILTAEHIMMEQEISQAYGGMEDVEHRVREMGLDKYLDSLEKKIILDVLHKNYFNVSRTAKELGIKRQTLQHKIKKYEIETKEK